MRHQGSFNTLLKTLCSGRNNSSVNWWLSLSIISIIYRYFLENVRHDFNQIIESEDTLVSILVMTDTMPMQFQYVITEIWPTGGCWIKSTGPDSIIACVDLNVNPSSCFHLVITVYFSNFHLIIFYSMFLWTSG